MRPPSVELHRLRAINLLPSMPVEVMIVTGNRSILSYILKPLSDHIETALKDR